MNDTAEVQVQLCPFEICRKKYVFAGDVLKIYGILIFLHIDTASSANTVCVTSIRVK